MNLAGDPGGLAALHEMKENNRDYLKFLLQEAKTVFEHHVDFKAKDGTAYRLVFDQRNGDFSVVKRA